jgi:two-component system chemotaxis response regulator CheB
MKRKTRVLVVDDSAIARELIERGLSLDPDIEVVGKASDAFSARDKIVLLAPDVVTLDVEMPRMDGIEFLKRLMPQYPIPVVVVSAVTLEGSRRALEALESGAVGVVAKPSAQGADGLSSMIAELVQRVKEAACADMRKLKAAVPLPRGGRDPAGARTARKNAAAAAGPPPDRIVAIGASTGGTTAVRGIITALPESFPPTLIVQHMPPVFTRLFAESLNAESKLEVREAVDGDVLRDGLALVAPGDLHLRLGRQGQRWVVHCDSGDKVSGHKPSVDVLFHSVAQAAGPRAVGLILTGMGRDGAEGMLAMRRAGARCMAQDEASSVVFGMPMEAWKCGAAEKLIPLSRAADELGICLAGMRARAP